MRIILSVLAGVFLAASAHADLQSDLELERDVLRAERKLLVKNAMEFSDAESKAFWPVFDEYAAEQKALNDRLIQLIEDFATQYDTLTDESARKLLEDSFTIREDRLKLRRKYLARFEKTLAGKRLARFFQVDVKLDTLLDALVAKAVPLAK